jgi:hypothetical protein
MLITTIFYVRLRRGVETEREREGEVGGEREKEREMRAERYPDEDVDDDHARREDHGDVEERQPRGRVLHRASSSSCSINPLFRFGGGGGSGSENHPDSGERQPQRRGNGP